MNLSFKKSFAKSLLYLFFSLSLLPINAFAQQKNYTVADAHAHNDYMHPVPFYTAWNAGFGSIEADVFPVNGELLVAHDSSALQSQRTLERLYIDPLLKELGKNGNRKVNLLIDIKENYKASLQLLIKELKPLKKYLFTDKDKTKPVTILISGERPSPGEYKNYPGYIFFDDDLKLFHTPQEWKRVGLVSLSFERYSSWNGEDAISEKDKNLLIHVIDSVHQAGKPIRFWAAPDNENSWNLQMKLGVDLIGTDKIPELSEFLKKK
ncbi:MAG TPA: phosphatidylinositol-specific phospholipase C/glycerophosphodiester phosphodiesterase family protein [Hanamia sp.]|nr:phosphatidylinositol-specific phospholipase C/glycerophosphodiester phosphodiesterase family protein [Hanamia sp.]